MTVPQEKETVRGRIRRRSITFLRYIPFFLTLVIVIACVIFIINHDFDELLSYTPDNYFLALIVLWGFYGLKSLSVVFPLTALFVASGAIFPFWIAVPVNLVGLAVSFTIPYLVGRFSGGVLMDIIVEKYPKAGRIVEYSHENNLFASYISRAVVVVPGDIVSMIHGALKMPYKPYLLGSLMGIMPEMLVQTYVGSNLKSMSFKTVVVLVLLIAVTLGISLAVNKRVSRSGMEEDKEDFYEFDYFDEWDENEE